MDKEAYCEQMVRSLQDLDDRLSRRAFPSPANQETSRMMEAAKRELAELRVHVAAVLADVRALRTSTDPSWEQARQDLDRRWQEVSEQASKFV